MESKEKEKLKFELKDLSYEELVSCYIDVVDFLNYINSLKNSIKKDASSGGDKK